LKLGFVKNSEGKGLDLSDDVHVLESKGLAFWRIQRFRT